jgi:methionyl-tRNA formyltransferase
MKKIYFLLNHPLEFKAQSYCDKYLFDCDISYGTSLPIDAQKIDLVIPWNYKKIIKNYKYNNVIVFHSSDLPEGKGWAPIFNVFNKKLKEYVISAILMDESVDSGDVVAKARFEIKNTYTANFIRKVDERITIMMISKIIEKFEGVAITGIKQDNAKETYYKRRYPENNKLNITKCLESLMPILKACEDNHPAFFEYEGDEFIISIKPKAPPTFPEDLEIVFS